MQNLISPVAALADNDARQNRLPAPENLAAMPAGAASGPGTRRLLCASSRALSLPRVLMYRKITRVPNVPLKQIVPNVQPCILYTNQQTISPPTWQQNCV